MTTAQLRAFIDSGEFAMIPQQVAKTFIVIAVVFANQKENDEFWPGMDTLAKAVGISVRQVKCAMKWLREEGYVELVKRQDGTWKGRARYRLNLPAYVRSDAPAYAFQGRETAPRALA